MHKSDLQVARFVKSDEDVKRVPKDVGPGADDSLIDLSD